MSSFILGGITVEFIASQDFVQTYSELNGKFRRRKMNGALFTQSQWSKLSTRLSGNGWLPYGLDGLDFSANMTLACAAPRSIASTSRVIDIPSARRSDANYTPYGIAIVDDVWQRPGQSMSTDEMTITEVTGADQYQAFWYPQITVQADYSTSFDEGRGVWSWTLTCEEV